MTDLGIAETFSCVSHRRLLAELVQPYHMDDQYWVLPVPAEQDVVTCHTSLTAPMANCRTYTVTMGNDNHNSSRLTARIRTLPTTK